MPWNERSIPCSRRYSRTSITVAPSARSRNASATTRRLLRVRLERPVVALPVAGRHVRERRHAAGDGAALRVRGALGGHAAMVLGDRAEHRRGEPAVPAVSARDLADVDGEDRPAGLLDPLDDLGLHRERPDEPVEVGDDDDVRLARPRRVSTARRSP